MHVGECVVDLIDQYQQQREAAARLRERRRQQRIAAPAARPYTAPSA